MVWLRARPHLARGSHPVTPPSDEISAKLPWLQLINSQKGQIYQHPTLGLGICLLSGPNMANIWQKQPKIGRFQQNSSSLIETEIEQPKAVYFGDGMRPHTTLKLILKNKRRKLTLGKNQCGLVVDLEWVELR